MLKLKDLNKLKFLVSGYLNWTTIFLVVPSAFLFFANIYLFDYLDENIYFLFGQIMIFISIQNSIGALAVEQLIIRNSGGEKRITLYFNIIGFSFGAIAFTSFILSRVININASLVVLFLVFFTTGLNMTISKVFKLLKKTELTTATTNFWKIFPVFFLLFKDFEAVLWGLIFINALATTYSFFVLFYMKGTVLFKRKAPLKTLFNQLTGFLLSLTTITVISFFDKILVFKNFSVEVANEYFFLFTLFTPISIFQNLNNIKYVSIFRETINAKLLKRETSKQTTLFVILIIPILTSIPFLLDLDLNILLIVISFSLISLIRLKYSVFSSVLSLRLEKKDLITIRVYSLMVLVCYFVLFNIKIGFIPLVFCFTTFWIVRFILWKKMAKGLL